MKHAFSLGLGFAIVSIGLCAGATAARAAEKHEMQITEGMSCQVCGMYIEVFKDTATEVTFENGSRECFCGVACTLRRINEEQGLPHVQSAYVTDWKTHELIPLKQAALVVGSDETPDMIPNLIAFSSEEEAASYRKEHGGSPVALEQALASISYQGMTMPFRITPAPTPPARVFSTGAMVSRMVKDNLMKGTDDVSIQDALKARPMAPRKMEATMASLAAGYAVSDDVYVDVMVPYWWKKMTSQTRMGKRMTFKANGIGDATVSGRWRFYHDEMADNHMAIVLRSSVPTGDFVEDDRARPGLQLGTGAFSAGGGLLCSHHIGLFWLNAGVEYRHYLENSSDYKFGDVLQGGLAIHFTPSTRTMLGIEVDASRTWENEDHGDDVANTGYDSAIFGNLVAQRRVAMFAGGNFDVRALAGMPLYEDMTGVQLGEDYHAAVGAQWKRRF